jgi:ankyrin repeat protein
MNINEQNFFGESKLILAVKKDDLEEVKRLIKSGINIEIGDHEEDTAIFYALGYDITILKYLVEVGKCNLSHKNMIGLTPITKLELWIEWKGYSPDKQNTWTNEEIRYYKDLLTYLLSKK